MESSRTLSDRSREYDRSAPRYDRIFGKVNAGIVRVAQRMLGDAPGRVLDVACGTGQAVKAFRAAGWDAVGLDHSAAMLAVGRDGLPDGVLILGDATAMPFAPESFDAVTTMMALHEMDAPMRPVVLAEVGRVLSPDGRFVVVDYHHEPVNGFKGRLMRAFTWGVERYVGGAHYAGYRDFMATGGLIGLLERTGWRIEKARVVSGGNLAAVRAMPPR
jgi:demethylmenaquinone methyltransferase/2-methoxy-6-polyprenyl-1,4-benzoquinol methylase